ncbi:hypothetical protein SSS_03283 [Sarcoptes scabiei]|nr:hypothetical protein SSS_03283 [Sarcoptes scabiei]
MRSTLVIAVLMIVLAFGQMMMQETQTQWQDSDDAVHGRVVRVPYEYSSHNQEYGYGGNEGWGKYGSQMQPTNSYKPQYGYHSQHNHFPQQQPQIQTVYKNFMHPCQLVSALGMIRNRAMQPLQKHHHRKPCNHYDLERIVDMINVLMATVSKTSNCGLSQLGFAGGSTDPMGFRLTKDVSQLEAEQSATAQADEASKSSVKNEH